MEIYIDSADINEIKKALSTNLITGITTNPSLLLKSNKPYKEEIKELIKIIKKQDKNFTLSIEIINIGTCEEILKDARELSKLDKRIIIKIPISKEGLKASKILSKEKIRTNLTLCFSANQALLAAKADAWCVSPFLGRVDDEGHHGIELLKEIREIYDNYNFKTKILAASIRSTEHVLESSKIKTDIVTISLNILEKMYKNPLTDIGIEKFNNDWKDYKYNK
jgi:transaldolase